jgi:hypothetical protein
MDALRDREKGSVSITFFRKGARRTVEAELEDAPRAMRLGPGRDMTIIRPHMDSREAPETRREIRRGNSEDSEELQQLRDEVRHLRQRIRELEGDRSKDRNKDQDNDRDDDNGNDNDNGNDDGNHN